ncbi:MAG: hypothetical protein LQ341_004392, partial [Variospora aurantia]
MAPPPSRRTTLNTSHPIKHPASSRATIPTTHRSPPLHLPPRNTAPPHPATAVNHNSNRLTNPNLPTRAH